MTLSFIMYPSPPQLAKVVKYRKCEGLIVKLLLQSTFIQNTIWVLMEFSCADNAEGTIQNWLADLIFFHNELFFS